MTHTTLTFEEAAQIAEAANDLTVHPRYSGRHMYGLTCLGFSGPVDDLPQP